MKILTVIAILGLFTINSIAVTTYTVYDINGDDTWLSLHKGNGVETTASPMEEGFPTQLIPPVETTIDPLEDREQNQETMNQDTINKETLDLVLEPNTIKKMDISKNDMDMLVFQEVKRVVANSRNYSNPDTMAKFEHVVDNMSVIFGNLHLMHIGHKSYVNYPSVEVNSYEMCEFIKLFKDKFMSPVVRLSAYGLFGSVEINYIYQEMELESFLDSIKSLSKPMYYHYRLETTDNLVFDWYQYNIFGCVFMVLGSILVCYILVAFVCSCFYKL